MKSINSHPGTGQDHVIAGSTSCGRRFVSKWEKGMATFGKPFTTAKVRYFDHTKAAEARDWLAGT